MEDTIFLDSLVDMEGRDFFSRNEYKSVVRAKGFSLSDASFNAKFQEMVSKMMIVRSGRNKYYVPKKPLNIYTHEYSKQACRIAEEVSEHFPYLDFVIFELVELNVFLNHQIGNNTIFLFVEHEICDFVFDFLKGNYPGEILNRPDKKTYHQYWKEDVVVILRLVSEAPMGKSLKWHTRIEKQLVDLLCEPVISSSISEGELPGIFELAFDKYVVDETTLFRYARRRMSEKKVLEFIRDNTNVKLRTRGI